MVDLYNRVTTRVCVVTRTSITLKGKLQSPPTISTLPELRSITSVVPLHPSVPLKSYSKRWELVFIFNQKGISFFWFCISDLLLGHHSNQFYIPITKKNLIFTRFSTKKTLVPNQLLVTDKTRKSFLDTYCIKIILFTGFWTSWWRLGVDHLSC